MKINIYTVRDRATDQYGTPMFMQSHGQAIRSFTDEINSTKPESELAKHPDDYDLYYLGTYETEIGTFETKNPEMVAIGKNVKVRMTQQ